MHFASSEIAYRAPRGTLIENRDGSQQFPIDRSFKSAYGALDNLFYKFLKSLSERGIHRLDPSASGAQAGLTG
jgi:hypothetical protein